MQNLGERCIPNLDNAELLNLFEIAARFEGSAPIETNSVRLERERGVGTSRVSTRRMGLLFLVIPDVVARSRKGLTTIARHAVFAGALSGFLHLC